MGKKIEKFEDLEVWKEGMRLVVDIYQYFSICTDFNFRNQIQKAAVSIPSNIAEGFDRQTNKEFIRYLYVAKGSSGELRTQLYLAIELGYLERKQGTELIDRTRKVSAMLFKLIKTREEDFH